MFKGKAPSSHYATNATWSKWIALITQRVHIRNPFRPGILEIITNWSEAVQLALDIAEREKWPKLYLYTDSWMVANALWYWTERWKKANWQRRGKPIWADDEWKDIALGVEKLPVKVRHVDAHVPKSRANEEHRHNKQIDQASKIEVSRIDLD
ncbi:hypothetical protein TURU_068913 [Turdus rufiventris]|nr:hypothetical protein TURU_068913 [Turdus rufiventris]